MATAAVSKGLATFTLTSYVTSHRNVCGTATFTADFTSATKVGVNTIVFTTNDGQTFSATVTKPAPQTVGHLGQLGDQ